MKKIITLTLLIILILSSTTIIYADTNNITLTSDKTKIKMGDTITITLKVKEKIQAADFSIKYSSDILKFKETTLPTDHYNASNGIIKVCTYSTSGEDTFNFTFDVIKNGDAEVTTDIEALNIDQNTENALSFKNETIKLTYEKEWTDFSKSNIKVVTDNEGVHIEIDGQNLNKDNKYDIYISYNKNDNPKDEDFTIKLDNETLKTSDISKMYDNNMNPYIWIRETDKNGDKKIVLEAYKIEEKKELPLGERIEAEFTEDYTNIKIDGITDPNRKVHYKIGEVTDKTIIDAIKKSKNEGLKKLLEYAKSDTKGQTGTVDIGKTNSILDKVQLKDKTYYYIYLTVDDGNGKYYPIEDIDFYMTNFKKLPNGTTIKTLVDYKSNDFNWTLSNDNNNNGNNNNDNNNGNNSNNNNNNNNNNSNNNSGTNNNNTSGKIPDKDTTVSNKPIVQTGESTTIIAVISIIMIIAIISIIKYRKYRDI